jgi:hypothetical protein
MSALQHGLYNVFCTYVTDKRIRVDLPIVSVIFRVVQLVFVIGYGSILSSNGAFMLSKEVLGSVEPYANNYAAGGSFTQSGTGYCSNADYDYTLDGDFAYVAPECEATNVYSINQKAVNYLSFSTVYVETQEFSWPCANDNGADAAINAYKSICGIGGSSGTAVGNGQCTCTKKLSKFIQQVEDNIVDLTSAYRVNNLAGQSWTGRSDVIPDRGEECAPATRAPPRARAPRAAPASPAHAAPLTLGAPRAARVAATTSSS